MGHDDIHLESGQLGREVGQPLEPAICKSIVNGKILALNPPKVTQPLAERDKAEIRRSPRPEIAYPVDLSCPLRRGERCKKDEGENYHRPDPPHTHLGWKSGGSLAELHYGRNVAPEERAAIATLDGMLSSGKNSVAQAQGGSNGLAISERVAVTI